MNVFFLCLCLWMFALVALCACERKWNFECFSRAYRVSIATRNLHPSPNRSRRRGVGKRVKEEIIQIDIPFLKLPPLLKISPSQHTWTNICSMCHRSSVPWFSTQSPGHCIKTCQETAGLSTTFSLIRVAFLMNLSTTETQVQLISHSYANHLYTKNSGLLRC